MLIKLLTAGAAVAKICFLAGAWLCALGFVKLGLLAFLAGGLRDVMRGDGFAIAFAASSLVGLWRVF